MTRATQFDLPGHSPEMALRALGVRCTVETMGSLAVVIPAPGERALEDARIRGKVLAALRAYGFTHAAVEPCDETGPVSTPNAPDA